MEQECSAGLSIAAFPCPPMPVRVLRGEQGEMVDDVSSSHDLIVAGMRLSRVKMGASPEDFQRRQMVLLKQYNSELDRLWVASGRKTPLEQVYEVMRAYTVATVALYSGHPEARTDLRFPPPEDAGEKIRAAAARHLSLFREVVGSDPVPLSECVNTAYGDIVRRFFVLYCRDGEREAGDSL